MLSNVKENATTGLGGKFGANRTSQLAVYLLPAELESSESEAHNWDCSNSNSSYCLQLFVLVGGNKESSRPFQMGNQESVPSPVGEEEINVSPQVTSNHIKDKQLSNRYMEGIPESNIKGDNSVNTDQERQSYQERSEIGEAREDEHLNSPVEQQSSNRTLPAPLETASMSFENEFPISPEESSRISDDQVQLDLPMADLMAYLQMVANHSSNLPLTRRDDPDLGRTVSSLTADEYALKCAAFIPSNIRILGGQFGKYGRVWDLPTSEEFDAKKNTREPGISLGGACSNALLKAIYDTESEINNVASPHMVDAKNLFEDDDDDSTIDTAGFSIDHESKSFENISLNGSNATSLTWAQLLKKMKTEMQGMGFNQSPAITSSYKFDLNKPFSLVPPEFKTGVNKKRTLLIGCNYRKTRDAKLKACHDDVSSIKDFLVNVYGFPESPDLMTILLDDKKHEAPTHKNITEAFKRIAEQSQPGDAVFILFTGHGCRVMDSPINATAESYDEALLPSDYKGSGIIRDTLIFKTLFAPMKKGVTVTCIIDCAHTGAMIDLPYLWSTKDNKKEEKQAKMSLNNDFSFVRFLKVVKTLYESSVFTRIGKTVGSELDKQITGRDDETAVDSVASLETMPENAVDEKDKTGLLCSIAKLITCQPSWDEDMEGRHFDDNGSYDSR